MWYFRARKIARAKFKHVVKIGDQLAKYPPGTRKFWALSKATLGNFCQPSLPPLHTGNDSLAYTAKEKADLLGTLFASNSTLDDQGKTPPIIPRCQSSMPEIVFRQKTIRQSLFSLDVHKSIGPDGISPLVLRTCAPEDVRYVDVRINPSVATD